MRSPVANYTISIILLAAALLLRWLLDPVLGDALPLVTLFGVVAVAVWLGGYRPAVLVAFLGYFAADYLFIVPRGQMGTIDIGDFIGFVAYLLTCAFIVLIGVAARKANARAGERSEVLRVTLASIGDAVITTDLEERITYLNSVAESLTGWSSNEATGKKLDTVFRIINEATRQPVSSPASRALRDGVVVGLANHTLLIRKDGKESPIDDSAAPIRDEGGNVSGCVLIFRDVSTQRETEAIRTAQLMSARVLASIVASSDDAIISKSLQGIVQSWNAAAERLFGYSAEEAIGRHISLIIPPDRLNEEDRIIASLKAGERIDHFETERVRSDGRRIRVSLTVSPIKDEAGNVIGASKIVRDVTQQREAEERERGLLADSTAVNAKFQAFFEQGALLAAIMDVDGKVLDTNRLSWEACGFRKEQIVGRPFWEAPQWAPSPELSKVIESASRKAATGTIFRAELPYFVADGSQRFADMTILPIKDAQGNVLFLAPTGIDITDRKLAEAEREKFVTLVENSTDFIGICDLQGAPIFMNRAAMQMMGIDDFTVSPRINVADFFFPEDRARILQEFFPLVLNKGNAEIEVRFRHFKTGAAIWMSYKVLSLKDDDGNPIALATVSQDITQRKRMEDNLRALASDLSEADRRKNEFLAILAHELRNPLAPISNTARALRLDAGNRNTVRTATEILERQVRQLSRLVDDLLDMSRITRGKIELRRERVELAPIVTHAVETTRAHYQNLNHQLTIDLPAEPIFVNADPARMTQILGNLLNNACKFTERNGRVWLSVEHEGDTAVIRVRDSGIGIAPEALPRVFDMFTQIDTSLERTREGLGIGLTLVKTLVELHEGSVEVRSEGLGRGSEFIVRIPLSKEASLSDAPADDAPLPPGCRRILIVDDNRDGAESLATLLKLDCHQTFLAHDGVEALDAAEKIRPDTVLLDIGLPTMNGYEVCRRIREYAWGKEMLVVAITGWGQDADREKSRAAGFDNHIVKPVNHEVLTRLFAQRGDSQRPQ